MDRVSFIILNWNHPHNIARLLPSLSMTSGINREVIVVDNGRTPDVVAILENLKASKFIDKLILEPINHFYSGGNNIGVTHADPASNFLLLLNSDVEIIDGHWLKRMIEWANGIPPTFMPYTWSDHPTYPAKHPRGIVSIDWGYDLTVPGYVRPEGWCCLIRREVWRNMSLDFPFFYGDLEMMASVVRDGHYCGCLSQWGRYVAHHHGGSHPKGEKNKAAWAEASKMKRRPDPWTWWSGLEDRIEALDFTLGEFERRSYMEW